MDMATIVTNRFPVYVGPGSDTMRETAVRRHVSHRSARALKLLGHAIEYLVREFLRDSTPPAAQNPRLQAVMLLMSLNSKVYSSCPEAPGGISLGERCRSLLTGSAH